MGDARVEVAAFTAGSKRIAGAPKGARFPRNSGLAGAASRDLLSSFFEVSAPIGRREVARLCFRRNALYGLICHGDGLPDDNADCAAGATSIPPRSRTAAATPHGPTRDRGSVEDTAIKRRALEFVLAAGHYPSESMIAALRRFRTSYRRRRARCACRGEREAGLSPGAAPVRLAPGHARTRRVVWGATFRDDLPR